MTINTRWLTFKGKAEIPEDLDTEKNLVIAGEFEVKDWKHSPNQDGTQDITYTILPIRLISQKESGERIKLKAQGKRHIAFYRAVMFYCKEHGIEDSEKFYDNLMSFINSHVPELVDWQKQNI